MSPWRHSEGWEARSSFVHAGFLEDEVKKLPAGSIHDVKYLLEPVGAAIIGVRDLGARPAFRIEFPEKVKGCVSTDGVPVFLQVGQVRPIHGNDIVEATEIFRLHLPGVSAELDPVGGGASDRPVVRALANVPTPGSRRIDLETARETFRVQDVTEYAFGQGRTTDVA
jgi:hypothetical protein